MKSFALLCGLIPLALLSSAKAELGRVDLEINETAHGDDDYITWAPTLCRARINPLFKTNGDLQVVLTNDAATTLPGRAQPLDGDVSFALNIGAGQTATQESVTLTLPQNGSWVRFYIAGRFPAGATVGRASSRDKDAIIEVHEQNVGGVLLDRQALMVRVRKDVKNLTGHERHRLLSAIRAVHQRGVYEKFVEVHDWASRGDRRHLGKINHPPYSYADAAHRDSNFLPWHRVDLLQFEREMQTTHPDATLHYWRADEADVRGEVFTADFYGGNEVDTAQPNFPMLNGSPYLDFVKFAVDNPLHGWSIAYQGRFANSSVLTRWPIDRTRRVWRLGNGALLPGEVDMLSLRNFVDFSGRFESDVHNPTHNWFGPPMRDCTVAPSDPIFWTFHSWCDHLWAKWQWKYDRFGTDGSDPQTYSPVGRFTPTTGGSAMGHYLEDTMWPWDGLIGESQNADADIRYRESRPPVAPIGLFPESPIKGHWPSAPAKPQVRDTIDYLGLAADRLQMGFCYDDIPYGVSSKVVRERLIAADALKTRKEAQALDVFLSSEVAAPQRLEAGTSIPFPADEAGPKLLSLLKSEAAPEVRSVAFLLLMKSPPVRDAALTYAMDLVRAGGAPDELQMTILETLDSFAHFPPKGAITYQQIQAALQEAARPGRSRTVRAAATAGLALRGDVGGVEALHRTIKSKDESLMSSAKAAGTLTSVAGAREHSSVLKPFIGGANHKTAISAILVLAADPESRKDIAGVLSKGDAPSATRVAALHALAPYEGFPSKALPILADPSNSLELQRESMALLRQYLNRHPMEAAAAAEFARTLNQVALTLAPSLSKDLALLREALERQAK